VEGEFPFWESSEESSRSDRRLDSSISSLERLKKLGLSFSTGEKKEIEVLKK